MSGEAAKMAAAAIAMVALLVGLVALAVHDYRERRRCEDAGGRVEEYDCVTTWTTTSCGSDCWSTMPTTSCKWRCVGALPEAR